MLTALESQTQELQGLQDGTRGRVAGLHGGLRFKMEYLVQMILLAARVCSVASIEDRYHHASIPSKMLETKKGKSGATFSSLAQI